MTKLTKEQLSEIKIEMQKKNFKYRQSNGIHNFINIAIKEGIEVKGDSSINPFWMQPDGSREYGYSQTGNETRTAVSIIEQILMGEPVLSVETSKEMAEIQTGGAQLYGIVPQYLTEELIAKHPGTTSCLIAMQKTNPAMIEKRPDGMYYVDVAYMTAALNLATLMNWSFEILETRTDTVPSWNVKKKEYEDKLHISCLGALTIVTTEGQTIQKQQWGSQVLKAKMEMGDALKAAASDSMKKCASMLGIAADVYGGMI